MPLMRSEQPIAGIPVMCPLPRRRFVWTGTGTSLRSRDLDPAAWREVIMKVHLPSVVARVSAADALTAARPATMVGRLKDRLAHPAVDLTHGQ